MTTIERILRELGRDTLRSMTQMQAAAYGYELAERLGPRTDDAQPVGGDIIAERMAKPALSAILPRRPDDVPPPPEGWDYAGHGRESNQIYEASEDITWFASGKWQDPVWKGTDKAEYAIRRTAPPDIWHRFGLLAPEEGGGFYPHTPGDPCPCDGEMRVQCVLLGELEDGHRIDMAEDAARRWDWRADGELVGWRPALGGAK